MQLRFEWDEDKDRSNLQKHGVSFEEASNIFSDPGLVIQPDRNENDEQRWHGIGLLRGLLLLLVAHTVRETPETEVVRIISARYAKRNERQIYEEANGYLHT